jgi:putative nucleotidyltransferase with HDIG domain
VAAIAKIIAEELKFSDSQIEKLEMAALIHDLGKIRIPAEILTKPTRLDPNEFTLIKAHPQVGYDIIKEIDFHFPLSDIILQHHERYDGSGYPGGLKKDEILIEARIITVADVVEAMGSHRPYRASLGPGKAREEIKLHSGTLYDPNVTGAFFSVFNSDGKLAEILEI